MNACYNELDNTLFNKEEHRNCFFYDNDVQMVQCFKRNKGEEFLISEVNTRIIFLLKGKIQFLFENSPTLFNEKTFILLPRGSKFMMKIAENSEFILINLHYIMNLCEHFPIGILHKLKIEMKMESTRLYPLVTNKIISNFLEGILMAHSEGLKCTYYLKRKQQELLYYLRAFYSKKELIHFFAPILNDDTEFAELIYRHHLLAKNIKDLAEITNYSVSGFKKRFQKVFSISPYKWMEKEKAKMIQYEINCTTKSFKEISLKYNFFSSSHFDSFCKKIFKMSPGVMREKTIHAIFDEKEFLKMRENQ